LVAVAVKFHWQDFVEQSMLSIVDLGCQKLLGQMARLVQVWALVWVLALVWVWEKQLELGSA
jgi:hypothetical protein